MVRRWRYYLLSIALALLACLYTSAPASALQLTSGSIHSFTSGYINVFDLSAGASADYNRKIYGSLSDPNLVFTGIPVINTVRQFHLSLSDNIVANSIFTFNVEYKIVGTTPQAPNYQYYGISSGSAWTLLDQSCVTPAQNGYGGTANNSFYYESILQCTYVGFTNVTLDHISTQYNADIITFRNQNTSASGNIDASMHFSPVNARAISWNALTQEDRAWLESVLPAGTSTADIEQAIDSAREDEKDEYEQQAEDNESDINDASADAEATGQSLLSILTGFLSVLTSAQPTNCNLDTTLIPHLSIPAVNLCQNSPPSAIVVLGSLILIGFVVPLAYHLVKRLLALIGEFQR